MAAVFISESIKSKYDLSCPNPKCGSINNIHVAGVYEFKNSPQKWYCRCGTCGKGFNPRKREGDDDMASIMATAQKILPKEKLGPLLAAGMTGKEIGADHGGLPQWAVSKLRKEYWPNGFNPKEYEQLGDDGMNNVDNQQEVGGQQASEDQSINEEQQQKVKPSADSDSPGNEPLISQDKPKQNGAVLDIHSLIKVKNALENDLVSIDRVYKLNRKLSEGVDKLLSQHQAYCTEQLELINQAFSRTLVTLEYEINGGNANACSV